MHVRLATLDDADALAALAADYMAELGLGHPGSTADELRRDVLSGASGQRVVVAEREGRVAGFAAWDRVYDMHWAAGGVLIAGLYVEPGSRGHGVALAMLAAVCAEGRAEGARFLRGASYDRASAIGRFYERIAVGMDSAECHCGGRASSTSRSCTASRCGRSSARCRRASGTTRRDSHTVPPLREVRLRSRSAANPGTSTSGALSP